MSCSTFETPSGGNFTETSAACPCCCTCVERIGSLRMALRRMPSDAALEELNQPINTSTLGDTIFNASAPPPHPLRLACLTSRVREELPA